MRRLLRLRASAGICRGTSEKRLPPKEVLNFQAPDRVFAVNKGLQTEVPRPDAAPVYRRPNGARFCCIALTPCR